MEDIARLAGVTAMTVSRALRSPQQVAEPTRARIEAAAKELGYTPNSVAGTLASSKSRFVVVIVPTITASIYSESYAGISSVLQEKGYEILLGNNGYSLEHEEDLVRSFLSYRPAGFILTGYTHSPGLRQLLQKISLPVVETYNLTDDPLRVSVGYSNFRAMYELVEHVMRRGARNPVFLATDYPTNDRHTDRKRAFDTALRDHGIEPTPDRVVFSDLTYAAAISATDRHLREHPETDAILTGSYVLAVGALFEVNRRKLRLPNEIRIAGFDDHELCSIVEPNITMIYSSRRHIGGTAARMLLDQIEGGDKAVRRVDVGFELIQRATT
jgi:LacI family gluconate utilization system Gnt-I transcriptional repressor